MRAADRKRIAAYLYGKGMVMQQIAEVLGWLSAPFTLI